MPLIIMVFIFHIVELLNYFLVLLFLLELLLSLLILFEFLLGLLVHFLEFFIVYYVVLGLHEVNQLYAFGGVLLEHCL